MAAPRRVIELAFSEQELADLTRVSRSRTEAASRVERARILLACRQTPSLYATGRAIGVVFGVMNLAWVACLAVVVLIEKVVPGGQRIALRAISGQAEARVGCGRPFKQMDGWRGVGLLIDIE